MSKKRPPSKRWDVDPDYEPPVTRLKVRNDPSIVIPPAQNVSLPTHSRKSSARVIPPVAAPAPPVAAPAPPDRAQPPPENQASEAQSENQIREPVPENEEEEQTTESQNEETLKDNEEAMKEDEEAMKEDEETMKDDEETIKQNEGSMSEDEETMKEDEETMKEDEETMKEDEETMKQNEGSTSENEETRKENEETMKEDEETMKEDEETMKEDEETMKDDEETMKGDEETMKDDEKTMKQNEGSMSEHEETRKEDKETMKENDETIKEIEETIKQSRKEKNAMENDTEELAARNQLEETLTLNQIEEMTWENQIEGAIVGHQVENAITGNQMENTEVDRIQQCVSNFGPEDTDEFEQRPMVNESDETIVVWTQTDQRTIEAEIWESAAKPVHERGYSYNLIIGLTGEGGGGGGGGGNPNGSTAKTFSVRDPERPTGKPVRDLTTLAHNPVLRNRAAAPAAPAAVSTQDNSGFVTSHPPLRLAAPQSETDQSGPRNDQPRLSKSEVIAALRRNALLLRTEPVLPKEDILKERRFVSTLVQGLEMLNEKLSFSVVSYNIMSEPETEIEGSGSGIGRQIANSLNVRAGTDHLPSNYNERILIELFYLEPDIFCLQSVTEKYWYRLEKYLNNWGYAGSMMCRRRLQGLRDCCEAIFFRTSRFELVTSRGIYLDDLIVQQSMQPDVAYTPGVRQSVESREVTAFMTLRCRVTDRKVTVASMRCVPEHKNRPDLQAAQVCCVVQALASLSANPSDPMPTILCGDLDFHPKSGPYQVLRDGLISEDTEQCFSCIESVVDGDGERCPLSSVDRAVFRHPMPSIRSAYNKVLGSEPPNVWKRESETFVCSSYVWYDEAQLKLVGALDKVASKAVTGSGIPNEFFPSGSLSLKASFQFFCGDMPGTE